MKKVAAPVKATDSREVLDLVDEVVLGLADQDELSRGRGRCRVVEDHVGDVPVQVSR